MIPEWNISGVLPPIRPGEAGHSHDRSPFKVSILRGLLNFRKALYQTGIYQGFQWFDGSFLENVEILESRSPKDIDVVTFFQIPKGQNQTSLLAQAPGLFDPDQTKSNFKVDAYYCSLGEPATDTYVRQIAYWHSLWSHRRNGIWKGFVQVNLSESEDDVAIKAIDSTFREEEKHGS